MSADRYVARLLRLSVVRQFYESKEITLDDAVEILQGCLDPGDEDTRVDDSALLNENREKAIELLKECEGVK